MRGLKELGLLYDVEFEFNGMRQSVLHGFQGRPTDVDERINAELKRLGAIDDRPMRWRCRVSGSSLKLPPEPIPLSYPQRTRAMIEAFDERFPQGGAKALNCSLPGWTMILECAVAALIDIAQDEPDAKITLLQIKEKFGSMRFYIEADGTPTFNELAFDIAHWAEMASEGRCMLTGKPGDYDHSGWFLTLCEEMKVLRNASRADFDKKREELLQ